jgi:predicted DNA-binding protein with PD1-like motif
MPIYRSDAGDTAMAALDENEDLLEGLARVAGELDFRAGSIQVIGAVKKLVVGYYDQAAREYRTIAPEGDFELASGLGNVSLKNGQPFVHVHVVGTGPDGAAIGGHLMPGTVVFVAEAWIRRLATDEVPTRVMDPGRGLALWG